ncbi:DUF1427 family protein [Streptomyces sp. NPDC003635]
MTAAHRARSAAYGRRLVISLAAGLAMGTLYRAFGITAPAPALLGLTGLLGIGLGERAATALGARMARRRARPTAPQPPHAAAPEHAPRCTCLPPAPH